jgi:hypothetical protein
MSLLFYCRDMLEGTYKWFPITVYRRLSRKYSGRINKFYLGKLLGEPHQISSFQRDTESFCQHSRNGYIRNYFPYKKTFLICS